MPAPKTNLHRPMLLEAMGGIELSARPCRPGPQAYSGRRKPVAPGTAGVILWLPSSRLLRYIAAKPTTKLNRPGRTIVVHKGRAACSAVDEIVFFIFSRGAAAVKPIDRLRAARAFLTVSGTLDRETSEIDKIPEPVVEPWMPRTRARAMAPRSRAEFFF
jgi:hypothetical protein